MAEFWSQKREDKLRICGTRGLQFAFTIQPQSRTRTEVHSKEVDPLYSPKVREEVCLALGTFLLFCFVFVLGVF